jgi:hypothetical protein
LVLKFKGHSNRNTTDINCFAELVSASQNILKPLQHCEGFLLKFKIKTQHFEVLGFNFILQIF